jgi:hypothetical protein
MRMYKNIILILLCYNRFHKNIILMLQTTKAGVHSLAKRQLEPYATLLHILIIYEHQLINFQLPDFWATWHTLNDVKNLMWTIFQ